jgi:hypothetical protein
MVARLRVTVTRPFFLQSTVHRYLLRLVDEPFRTCIVGGQRRPEDAADATGVMALFNAAWLSLRSGAAPFRSLGRISVTLDQELLTLGTGHAVIVSRGKSPSDMNSRRAAMVSAGFCSGKKCPPRTAQPRTFDAH